MLILYNFAQGLLAIYDDSIVKELPIVDSGKRSRAF